MQNTKKKKKKRYSYGTGEIGKKKVVYDQIRVYSKDLLQNISYYDKYQDIHI